MPDDRNGMLRKRGRGKNPNSRDRISKGFIFGPFKVSALNALWNHEENLEYFN